MLVSPFFARVRTIPLFTKAIEGVLCSFVGLLVSAALRLGLAVAWDIPRIALAVIALAALLLRIDLLCVVLAGVGISALLHRSFSPIPLHLRSTDGLPTEDDSAAPEVLQ